MNLSQVMAPNHHFLLNTLPVEPVSRTYQYRKIMKPMLERKRRARINKCLDELKDLMTGTLQADGENVSKLEKADILELTVRHLHRLRENNKLFLRNSETLQMDKFWAGFQHCATEVAQFLTKYDYSIRGDLIKHIGNHLPSIMAKAVPASNPKPSNLPNQPSPSSPSSSGSVGSCYPMGGRVSRSGRAPLSTTMNSRMFEVSDIDGCRTYMHPIHPYMRPIESGDVWRPW